MGTRALGAEPWLIDDAQSGDLLVIRRALLSERREEVLATPASADVAVDEIIGLVEAEGVAVERSADHGLARLGRSIIEDAIILRRGLEEWEFEAGVLCFPSRWRLHDKLGRPLREVHGPTPGYDPVLADRVTSLLDRLGDRIVRRRNWFVHPNAALFQPDRPVSDPVIGIEDVGDRLFVRSERQTLRALPNSGRVLFTVGTQQCTIGEFVAEDERRRKLLTYLTDAPTDQIEHRGISKEQRQVLLDAFT